jgi:drug/metabolite transporter (DMT)-like permease
MIYIPFIGALALGGATVLEKIILKKKSMDTKLYQTASFFAILIAMLPLVFFFWKLDQGAFITKNILIFLGVIASSVTANLFYLYSLKGDKVTNTEPARILEPLFVISLTLAFGLIIEGFYKTDSKFIFPALIAAAALIFPHIKREKVKFNKYFIYAILGSLFFAFELVLSKLILEFYSPITFYFLRCFFIFIVSYLLFKPKLSSLDKKSSLLIFGTACVWVAYRIAVYFGYMKYGIIFTTLITMIAPVIIYLLASKFLKEKLNWKNIASSVIIIGCVIYAVLA